MADPFVDVITAATNFDLITLADLKTMLGMSPTDTTKDPQFSMLITQNSIAIANACNRVFAKETLHEIWRCNDVRACPDGSLRVYLTHAPVLATDLTNVESPVGTPLDPSQYELEEQNGRLTLWAGTSEIVADYTGGYLLPGDAPEDLQQACGLRVRQVQAELLWLTTSGSGIRQVSHKESRVTYFSPKDMMMILTGGAKAGGPIATAIDSILYKYTRYWI